MSRCYAFDGYLERRPTPEASHSPAGGASAAQGLPHQRSFLFLSVVARLMNAARRLARAFPRSPTEDVLARCGPARVVLDRGGGLQRPGSQSSPHGG